MDQDSTRVDFGRVSVHLGDRHGKYPDGNQVIVHGRDSRVVFDSPRVSNALGPIFDDADLIVLGHVHEDHMAGLHRLPNTPLYVHQADVAAARSWDALVAHYGLSAPARQPMRDKIERDFHYVERPDAIGFTDGMTWEVGGSRIRAIHMPGHTSGHSVLLIEPEGVAFIGDIDLSGFGPYYGDATSDLGAFRRTLRHVAQIEARVWVTSHHRGVYTDRSKMLDDLARFAAKIDQREHALLTRLRAGPAHLDGLAQEGFIYPAGYSEIWAQDAERRSLWLHLDELRDQGRVVLDPDERWRFVN